MIDIKQILSQISEDYPAGENLEDDQDFMHLELISKDEPDKVIRVKDPETGNEVDKVTPGKQSDADEIINASLALFKRTKDLRIAANLCCALTRKSGLIGFEQGLNIIEDLHQNYWDTFYPELITEENNDPIFRVNVLRDLLSSKKLIRNLRDAQLVNSREIGRFKLIDLEIAQGKQAPQEGRTVANIELLQAALAHAEDDTWPKSLNEIVSKSLERVESIISILKNHGVYLADEWKPIRQLLQSVLELSTEESASAELPNTEESATGEGAATATKPIQGKLQTRTDASRELKAISEFLKKTEPAHPAPILIDRAIKLLEMDFIEIIEHLVPDAMSQIRHIGGIVENES